MFQKSKNAIKNRLIVSYWVHPLKRIYNYGSRALAFVLKHACMPSFTLWKTSDITPSLRRWIDDLLGKYGSNSRLLTACADAKEMYTSLKHAFVIQAIECIVDRCRTHHRKGRRGVVRLQRGKRGPIFFGRSANTTQYVNLTFTQILEIVVTDIRTCYFKSLGVWLWQVVGVPMGSPGSPTYAICICAYCEYQFHQSVRDFAHLHKIPDWERIFRAARYVDDILFVTVYDASSPESLRLAQSVVRHVFDGAYHSDMTIEAEPSDGWFPFLETLIQLPPTGPLSIRFQNKKLG